MKYIIVTTCLTCLLRNFTEAAVIFAESRTIFTEAPITETTPLPQVR